jgi:hypothetical protein
MSSLKLCGQLLIVPLLVLLIQVHQAFGSHAVYQRGDSVPLFANKACICHWVVKSALDNFDIF